jgi:hypothetical protein
VYRLNGNHVGRIGRVMIDAYERRESPWLSFPKIASGDELRPRNDAWRSCMGSELRIPNAAAQTRIVSGGPFGRAKESLSRHLKYMAGARIPEFESYMASQPVRCPARTHR